MQFDSIQEIANSFLNGLSIETPLKPEDKLEISQIFSKTSSSPTVIGKLREKISKVILNAEGSGIEIDLGKELSKVDRYIHLFFASNFDELVEATLMNYEGQIKSIRENAVVRDSSRPEILFETVCKALGRLGGLLQFQIEEFKMKGFSEHAARIEDVIRGIANGGNEVDDFIAHIKAFNGPATPEVLKLLKENIHTVISISVLIQEALSDPNKLINLESPSQLRLNEVKDFIRNKYVDKIDYIHLQPDQVIEIISEFEKDCMSQLRQKGFLLHFKEDYYDFEQAPQFISQLRNEILEKLPLEKRIEILELPGLNYSKNQFIMHWKILLIESMKGNEADYKNHLRKIKNFKDYPWDLFLSIAKNGIAERGIFSKIFKDNIHLIPKQLLPRLIDVFLDLTAPVLNKAFVNSILAKCGSLSDKLSYVLEEDLQKNNNSKRKHWNKLVLERIDQLDFSHIKTLKEVASYLSSLPQQEKYTTYYSILNHLYQKPYLRSSLANELEKQFQRETLQMNTALYSNLDVYLQSWCKSHGISTTPEYFEFMIPRPIAAYREAAALRFQDRTLPEDPGGIISIIGSKLESEALSELASSKDLSEESKQIALLLSERMKLHTYFHSLKDIYESKIAQKAEVIEQEKQKFAETLSQNVKGLKEFPNDFLIVPAAVYEHTMELIILKQRQADGKSKLILLMTNTGLGLDNWHPGMIDVDPPKYANTARVGEISVETGESLDTWKALIEVCAKRPEGNEEDDFSTDRVNALYRHLNKLCGRREDSKLRMLGHKESLYPLKRSQYGGVCVVRSIREVSKTLFHLILSEKRGNKTPGEYAESYFESERAIHFMDMWISSQFLSDREHPEALLLKTSKKGTDIFKEISQSDFVEARNFLLKQFGKKTYRLFNANSLGEKARELKDITKELVLHWISADKTIRDVQKIKGHRILEIAKLRFEYKRRGVDTAIQYIREMRAGELSQEKRFFIVSQFKEMHSYGAGMVLLNEIKALRSSLSLNAGNAELLTDLMCILTKNPEDKEKVFPLGKEQAYRLFGPLMTRIIGKAKGEKLSGEEYAFFSSFYASIDPYFQTLKPLFKSISKHPMTIGEFVLVRGVLESTAQTRLFVDLLLKSELKRNPKATPKEVLFPLILSMRGKLHAQLKSENDKSLIYDKLIVSLVVEVGRRVSEKELKELEAYFPSIFEEPKGSLEAA